MKHVDWYMVAQDHGIALCQRSPYLYEEQVEAKAYECMAQYEDEFERLEDVSDFLEGFDVGYWETSRDD